MIQDHFDMESWERVAFGKVVQNKNENTSNPSLEGLSRVVGLDHMDSESLPLVRWSELDDLPDGTTFTRRFHAGQVLFGKRRSYQKKVSFPDFDGVCSGDILVFQSLDSKRLLPGFLPLLVQSDPFMDFAISTSAGSLSPRTKWSDLSKFEFLLPSLKNQEEIVEIIRSIDQTIIAYQDLSLSAYRQSIMHEFLSDGGGDWTETTLGDIAKWGSGGTPKSDNQMYYNGDIPWCVIGDLTEGEVFVTEKSISQEGLLNSSAKMIEPGAVMIAMYGASIGRTGIAAVPMATNQAIAYAYVHEAKAVNLFLLYYLQFQKEKFIDAGQGAAQPNISQTVLKNWPILLPSIKDQNRIAAIISSVDVVIQSADQAVADAKALRKSILGQVVGKHSRV